VVRPRTGRAGNRGLIDAGPNIGSVGAVRRGRLTPLVAIVASIAALAFPTASLAQGAGPFPGDQQPISDEYGLPPLDHQAHSGGAGGGGGSTTGSGAGGGALGAAGSSGDGSLSVGDVRRGERGAAGANAGSAGSTGGTAGPLPERVGIGHPLRPPLTGASDPRGGFDVLLLVLAGLAAAGLVVAGLSQLRRP
jgi:hypothetical protein